MRAQANLLIILGCATAAAWGSEAEDYGRAKQLLKEGQPREAAAIFRQLARADSSNSDLLLNLTVALYQAADYAQAAASARDALKLSPQMLPARLFLGASYLELGELSPAITELDAVMAAQPNERNGRLLLGRALLASGQPERAAEQFTAASQLIPGNPSAWYGLGEALEASGKKDEAREAWRRLSELPLSLESFEHAAEVQDAAERWLAAAAEWRDALKLAPGNRAVRVGLARALFRARDYTGAMEALQPLLPTENADISFLWGASLMNLQKSEEAVPYLRKALTRIPHMLPASAALGQALLQIGKPEEAIPFLVEAESGDSDGSVHFQLFRAYQLTGRKADALQAKAAFERLRKTAVDH